MKKVVIICSIIIVIIIVFLSITLVWYNSQLNPVENSENAKNITIEIESGTSTEKVLELLKENGLIKNVLAAKMFMKINNVKSLQAGKYTINSSKSLEEVLKQISSGKVDKDEISVTFLEGKNMRWIAKRIAEKTSNSEEEVFKLLEDKEYIKNLIGEYWFLTDDILNENIYYPLEGYLYPETYNFKKDATVKQIFKGMLDQTEKILDKYKNRIEEIKGSVHEILTMASVVELEGSGEEARKGIAGVFYNRIKNKMSLGSDVTTYYAFKVEMSERNLYSSEINTENPYNTRGPNMAGKLPVGPIASVSEESINAVLYPTQTDALYFVSDVNEKIYFTKTYEEHKKMIESLQKQGLWYTYN